VKEVVRQLYLTDIPGIEPTAVELKDSKLFLAVEWLNIQGLLLPHEIETSNTDAVTFVPGDILLMLDYSCGRYAEYYPVFEAARKFSVRVITVIYDLLPISLPDCVVEGAMEWFESWLCDAIKSSDSVVCISETVAKDVREYAISHQVPNIPNIGYWHLGSDFSCELRKEISDLSATKILTVPSPYLLMVGTIEPRKQHALALAAMEQLWENGHEMALCVVGKEGWMVEDLVHKLRTHPELSNKLYYFEQVSDEKLSQLYSDAAGLVFISKGEGFGLPIIEAAHHGTPVICSDIPVFREVAQNHATYTVATTPNDLANDLKNWYGSYKNNELPDIRRLNKISWKESAEWLLDVLLNNLWLEFDADELSNDHKV